MGGLAGGDAFCQSAADARRLGGSWKAWLSGAMTSASARLTHATVPYVLLDGTTVAANWTALTSGTLAHGINISEDGTVQTAALEAWTGTYSSGGAARDTCYSWTSASASDYGYVGLSSQTSGSWTRAFDQFCDRMNVHLYCFEQ